MAFFLLREDKIKPE